MDWSDLHKSSAALCAWREARNQGRDGIRAVLHVIQNRAKASNKTWSQIVYEYLQFSSMTYPHDPQLTKVPIFPDPEFRLCMESAELIFNGGDYDLTEGADHYFSDIIPIPDWAKSMKFLIKIGNHSFYYGAYHENKTNATSIASNITTSSTTENPHS